jgi:hypothetical protein
MYCAGMRTERARNWSGQLLAIAVGLQSAAVLCSTSGQDFWDTEIGAPGVEGYQVSAIAVGADGVYIGGTFWRVGGVTVTNLAKWDGQCWSAVGSGLGTGVNHGVGSLVSCRGTVYAGGLFPNAGAVPALNVAAWDGTNWHPLGSGIPGVVLVLATDGSNVYFGGSFTNAGGITASNIARWDGAQWWPLGEGVNGAIDAIAVGRGGVYVGGAFTRAGGVYATNIACWDGTNWRALGSGVPSRVRSLAVREANVYAGSAPFRQDGTNAVYLSQWNSSEWRPIGITPSPAAGSVLALAVCGSDLYAGGGFVWMNGLLASGIAKWDGRNWSALGSGFTQGGALELACTGTELFVGGGSATAGGHPSTNIALWHVPHSVTIKPSGGAVRLSWPATGTNFLLEAREDLRAGNWAEVSEPPIVDKDECVVTNEMSGSSAFYRLRRKPWWPGAHGKTFPSGTPSTSTLRNRTAPVPSPLRSFACSASSCSEQEPQLNE